MARWHRAEVEKSCLCHANEDAKNKGEKDKGGGGGGGRGGAAILIPPSMKAENNRQIV